MSERKISCDIVFNILIYNDKKELLVLKDKDDWKFYSFIKDKNLKINDLISYRLEKDLFLKIDDIKLLKVSDNEDSICLNYIVKVSESKKRKDNYKWFDTKSLLSKKNLKDSNLLLIKKYIELINQEDNNDFKSKYQRSLADYQNLIKRNEEEKKEFIKYALNDFLHDLLPIYNHLKLSLKSLPEEEKKNAWVIGVEHVLRQFKDLLKNKGIEEIKTVGQKFDHNLMEALEGEGEIVVKEVSPGYTLNGKLFKAAKVIVNKNN